MKQKSLRQLARDLGVSYSYLSQVKNGKRPPSAKVVSNGKHGREGHLDPQTFNSYNNHIAGVAELADAADLKSAGAILVGSSPTPGSI